MSDVGLLVFGCVVSFVAAAGAYVHVRERFLAGPRKRGKERAAEARRDSRTAA